MKTYCDYCGSIIDDTLEKCPNCGAVNVHMQRSADQIPKTIEELQAFAQEKGIPLEKMRFFIGIDYKEPRAFGIYKEGPGGNCVVYKNKADGSRAIRYRGTDEAYAVNEIYQKMKAELLERKQADLDRGKAANTANTNTGRNTNLGKKTGCLFGVLLAIIVSVFLGGFVLLAIFSDLDYARTPKSGYYDYNGTPYYYTGGDWYTPDEYGNWERDYDAPDTLEENYNDYFEAGNYSNLDSDYAEGIEEYPTEAYSYSYDDDDSWNDSNWDDDDWDYDYDSYDSYDSDWDSDW